MNYFFQWQLTSQNGGLRNCRGGGGARSAWLWSATAYSTIGWGVSLNHLIPTAYKQIILVNEVVSAVPLVCTMVEMCNGENGNLASVDFFKLQLELSDDLGSQSFCRKGRPTAYVSPTASLWAFLAVQHYQYSLISGLPTRILGVALWGSQERVLLSIALVLGKCITCLGEWSTFFWLGSYFTTWLLIREECRGLKLNKGWVKRPVFYGADKLEKR